MTREALSADPRERLRRARLSLEGLSVGDAFGERFFVHPDVAEGLIASRAIPAGPWAFTDDTVMAVAGVEVLARHWAIVEDDLAARFAEFYELDPSRGYGPAMHRLLTTIRAGASWRAEAPKLFEGQGSFGNGSAMRAGPIGAYFADDLAAVVEHARRSSVVTHSHPEAIAGAIAVALAAAWAVRWRAEAGDAPTCADFLDRIRAELPDSVVAEKLRHARDLDPEASVRLGVAALGNGEGVSAQDTVPFALWCAGRTLTDYEQALWRTVSGLGDRDTTCAIVGSIVASCTGPEGIPAEWLAAREPLPISESPGQG